MSGSTNRQVRSAHHISKLFRWCDDNPESGASTYLTEDTFALLDALEADADAIRDLAPRICLEIGRVRVPLLRAPLTFFTTSPPYVSLDQEPASSQLSWDRSSALPMHVRTRTAPSLFHATKN